MSEDFSRKEEKIMTKEERREVRQKWWAEKDWILRENPSYTYDELREYFINRRLYNLACRDCGIAGNPSSERDECWKCPHH